MNRIPQLTILALAIATPAAAQGVMLERTAPQTALLKQAIEGQAIEHARVAVESRVTPGAPVLGRRDHRVSSGPQRRQSHLTKDDDPHLS